MFGTFTKTNDSPVETAAAPAEQAGEIDTLESATNENESQTSTDDTTTSDEGSDESQTDTDETVEEVKKPKKGFERRIEKFNQKLSAKDQEIEYWKRAAMGGTPSEAKPVVQQAPAGKPVFSDYNDIEAFTEALTDWKVTQALSNVNNRQQAETVVKTYEGRLNEFKKTTPDFQDVLDEFVADYGDVPVPEIVQIAMESEVGPQIAYYLAKNTSEVDRIAALAPHRRLVELGKLEAMLQQPTRAVETKKVSKAPAPIESVKGTGKVVTKDINDPNLPYAEWVKLRNAQVHKR